jgi:hypothetical protein
LKHFLLVCVVILGAFASAANAASIFRCTRQDGAVEFTNAFRAKADCRRIGTVAPMGWTQIAQGDGFIVFLSDRASPKGAPGGWVLWDYDSPRRASGFTFRSAVTRYDVQCDRMKAQISSTTWYSQVTMQGDVRQSSQSRDIDPVPGSVDDVIVSRLCARR